MVSIFGNLDKIHYQTVRCINILLLGEPQSGKSTFINALVNYLNYESIAIKRQYLKPVSTDLQDPWNPETYNRIQTYEIPVGDTLLKILDTPGIDDVPDDDRVCNNILTCLGQLSEIHAICFFIKPNHARVKPFEISVRKILMRLHPTACHHVVFIMTNCLDTCYDSQNDTIQRLKNIISKFYICPPNLDIPFGPKNIFYVENAGFINLIGKRIIRQEFDYKFCKQSTIECQRLMNYIHVLVSHKLEGSISINEARRLIAQISLPLSDIAQNIITNLAKWSERTELRVNKLEAPTVICTSTKCTSSILLSDMSSNCHSSCFAWNTFTMFPGDPGMLNCRKMVTTESGSSKCKNCSCSSDQHMRIFYKASLKPRIGQIKEIQSFEELEGELHFIFETMVRFDRFLRTHFERAAPDCYQNYLLRLIDRPCRNSHEKIKQKRLKYLLELYEETKEDFESRYDPSLIETETIIAMVQNLYELNLNGAIIKKLMRMQEPSKWPICNELFTKVYRDVIEYLEEEDDIFVKLGWLYQDYTDKSLPMKQQVDRMSPIPEYENSKDSRGYDNPLTVEVDNNQDFPRMFYSSNSPDHVNQRVLKISTHNNSNSERYSSETSQVAHSPIIQQPDELEPQVDTTYNYNGQEEIPLDGQQQHTRHRRSSRQTDPQQPSPQQFAFPFEQHYDSHPETFQYNLQQNFILQTQKYIVAEPITAQQIYYQKLKLYSQQLELYNQQCQFYNQQQYFIQQQYFLQQNHLLQQQYGFQYQNQYPQQAYVLGQGYDYRNYMVPQQFYNPENFNNLEEQYDNLGRQEDNPQQYNNLQHYMIPQQYYNEVNNNNVDELHHPEPQDDYPQQYNNARDYMVPQQYYNQEN